MNSIIRIVLRGRKRPSAASRLSSLINSFEVERYDLGHHREFDLEWETRYIGVNVIASMKRWFHQSLLLLTMFFDCERGHGL